MRIFSWLRLFLGWTKMSGFRLTSSTKGTQKTRHTQLLASLRFQPSSFDAWPLSIYLFFNRFFGVRCMPLHAGQDFWFLAFGAAGADCRCGEWGKRLPAASSWICCRFNLHKVTKEEARLILSQRRALFVGCRQLVCNGLCGLRATWTLLKGGSFPGRFDS